MRCCCGWEKRAPTGNQHSSVAPTKIGLLWVYRRSNGFGWLVPANHVGLHGQQDGGDESRIESRIDTTFQMPLKPYDNPKES